MRVAVDLERCQANGVCAHHAPEVFEVRGAGVVVLQEQPGDHLYRAVREAARRCPTRAIRVDGERR